MARHRRTTSEGNPSDRGKIRPGAPFPIESSNWPAAPTRIGVEVYSEERCREWDDFVLRSKNGSFLFLRNYMDYHRERFEDYSFLFRDGKDRLIAVMPAHRVGDTLASHAGLTFGGIVTDERMKTRLMLEVFEGLLAHLCNRRFKFLDYRSIPYIYHKIPADEDRLALFQCGAELVRRRVLTVVCNKLRAPYQERRRRGIEKAIHECVTIEESKSLPAFWKILDHCLMTRHRVAPVHTIEEITLLKSRFPDGIRLFAARKGGDMLGGTIIFDFDTVAHVMYVASTEQGRKTGALDLLFHYLLTEVYTDKPYFDFGGSDVRQGAYLNRGLIDQKEGFGARAVVQDYYRVTLNRYSPGQLRRIMNQDS